MNLLDPTLIRDIVDYSFGDQSGVGLIGGYMKEANENNKEFMVTYNNIKKEKKIMTLFIDNIRLYRRPGIKYTAVELVNGNSKQFKDRRVKELSGSDLLELCGKLSDIEFVIFTSFEDTQIDEEIFDKIPSNVLDIYSTNAIDFGGKVHPIPYGLQRKISPHDDRHQIIRNNLNVKIEPKKLLYLNHNVNNNPERVKINDYFSNFNWVTIDSPNSVSHDNYVNYLKSISSHKFMLCPSGNATGCDCHRDWEVIYMGRVPIVKRSDYLETIFKGIPVLFVDDFQEVTEQLLIDNHHLYEEMQNFDLNKLDFIKIYENILKNYDT